jgi:hypothetical protein
VWQCIDIADMNPPYNGPIPLAAILAFVALVDLLLGLFGAHGSSTENSFGRVMRVPARCIGSCDQIEPGGAMEPVYVGVVALAGAISRPLEGWRVRLFGRGKAD